MTVSVGLAVDELELEVVDVEVDVGVVEVLLVVELWIDEDVGMVLVVVDEEIGSSDSVSEGEGAAEVVGAADEVVGGACVEEVPRLGQMGGTISRSRGREAY